MKSWAPVLHRLDGHRDIPMAGNQHHGQFRIHRQYFAQKAHAIHVRQADVAHDNAAKVRVQTASSFFRAGGAFGGDAFQL